MHCKNKEINEKIDFLTVTGLEPGTCNPQIRSLMPYPLGHTTLT